MSYDRDVTDGTWAWRSYDGLWHAITPTWRTGCNAYSPYTPHAEQVPVTCLVCLHYLVTKKDRP